MKVAVKVRYKILNASSIEIRVLQGCRIRLASVRHEFSATFDE